MPLRAIPFLLMSFFLITSCKQSQSDESGSDLTEQESVAGDEFSLDMDAIATMIMDRAAVRPGEKVLMVAEPGNFEELIPLLRQQMKDRGAEDLGIISITKTQPSRWATAFTQGAEGMNERQLTEYFRAIDLGIMLPGAGSGDLVYRAIQNTLDEGIRRTIHFHWAGAYDMQMNEISRNDRIDKTYQQALLSTDYDRLAAIQKLFEREMREKTVLVTTPSGTDISFEVGDRPVTKQDGNASAARARKARSLIDREIELPAGAVRVAPIEGYVNGVIRFPDSDWGGTMVRGLIMTFEKGKVTEWSATEGRDAVQAVFDEWGDAARSFREFAIGLNPLLAIPDEEPWIPYYGYGAGVVRLSLGDNSELGGNVTGRYVRWNFFTDATVMVGDDVWVRDGKLMVQ